MEVRHALPADEDAIVALWQSCGLVTIYNDPSSDFRHALGGPASTVLVVYDHALETIVGSVIVGEDGHRGWLYYVATHQVLRGRGIGRALVTAAENWLRGRGVLKAQLLVREGNASVLPFYESLEYEQTPRIIMAKWLVKDEL